MKPPRSGGFILSFFPFFPVVLFPIFFSGCLEFDPVSTVCWEPEGRAVAFLSGGRPWTYTLGTGELSPLPSEGPFGSLACSPDGRWIAASSHTYLSLFRREGGGYQSEQTFALPGGDGLISPTLSWHPSSRRLMAGLAGAAALSTFEVDLDSGTMTPAGAGLGIFGGADWLLWGNKVSLGKSRELLALDRQDEEGRPLPLSRPAHDSLEDGAFDLLSSLGDFAALPLCWSGQNGGRTFSACLAENGSVVWKSKALPKDARIFANPARTLFAGVVDDGKNDLRLAVFDGQGKIRADGARLLKTLDAELARAGRDRKDSSRSIHASRVAWDPGGNWLAWVVDGRLFLWNWRNDILAVRGP